MAAKTTPEVPMVALTVADDGVVLAGGTIDSQGALAVAFHESGPPVLPMERICGAGLGPPCCAEKVRLCGLTVSWAGGGAVTVYPHPGPCWVCTGSRAGRAWSEAIG